MIGGQPCWGSTLCQPLLAELSPAATGPQHWELGPIPERRHLWPAGGPDGAQGSEEPHVEHRCLAAVAVGGCSANQDASRNQPPACQAPELRQEMALLQQRLDQASAVAAQLRQAHAATGAGNAEELQQRQQARTTVLDS